ncbi:hypothetical protein NHQ30_006083 [Ciborinia camelliae]|nr:hypothetical protein NHQ30_006083 [Ciborinia camelliae]
MLEKEVPTEVCFGVERALSRNWLRLPAFLSARAHAIPTTTPQLTWALLAAAAKKELETAEHPVANEQAVLRFTGPSSPHSFGVLFCTYFPRSNLLQNMDDPPNFKILRPSRVNAKVLESQNPRGRTGKATNDQIEACNIEVPGLYPTSTLCLGESGQERSPDQVEVVHNGLGGGRFYLYSNSSQGMKRHNGIEMSWLELMARTPKKQHLHSVVGKVLVDNTEFLDEKRNSGFLVQIMDEDLGENGDDAIKPKLLSPFSQALDTGLVQAYAHEACRGCWNDVMVVNVIGAN